MSGNAWIVGVASTPFARMGERGHASLAEEVVGASLADAGASGADVGRVRFGNCGMHAWGQPNIRGQVDDATLGVTQNAGGLVAVDEAMCGVAVLART